MFYSKMRHIIINKIRDRKRDKERDEVRDKERDDIRDRERDNLAIRELTASRNEGGEPELTVKRVLEVFKRISSMTKANLVFRLSTRPRNIKR